jgi:hypothetical protein
MKPLMPITAVVLLALSSNIARPETPEEREACIGDAFRVCFGAIPDRERVHACLLQNVDRLSNACRMVLARNTPEPANPGARRVPRPEQSPPPGERNAGQSYREPGPFYREPPPSYREPTPYRPPPPPAPYRW